jgi:hypothetical protein
MKIEVTSIILLAIGLLNGLVLITSVMTIVIAFIARASQKYSY